MNYLTILNLTLTPIFSLCFMLKGFTRSNYMLFIEHLFVDQTHLEIFRNTGYLVILAKKLSACGDLTWFCTFKSVFGIGS